MERNLKHQIVFFLTGSRRDSNLQPLGKRYRPALLANYSDLTALRYDFPMVLGRTGDLGRSLLSLSGLVDQAVEEMGADRDRVARHGYRIEKELRRELTDKGSGDFGARWDSAVARARREGETQFDDSAKRLWKAFGIEGDLADLDARLPSKLLLHAWRAAQARKAEAYRDRAERLILKLQNILAAEAIGSAAGRAPEALKAGVGAAFEDSFDFQTLSRVLVESKPSPALTDSRRRRIQDLLKVLQNQKFYAAQAGGATEYGFSFDRCSDALQAYQERHDEAVALIKALAMADLETKGEYQEAVHGTMFEAFGANGLDRTELAELPDYLVCAEAHHLDAAEMGHIVELLAANLPIKVLVQTDDVLEPSVVAEGHVALGLRARQLVDTAIGLTDVFVFQASASQLFARRGALLDGLTYPGPALFSIFSGSNDHTLGTAPYLVAAAAVESRVFPTLVYNPAAGSDWASRLSMEGNPQPEADWPTHPFTYEDDKLQVQRESISFTLADFMAMDDRFFRHYAVAAPSDWNSAMVPVTETLDWDGRALPSQVPYIALVDDEGKLNRAVVDDRTVLEAKRCRAMWHSLQELGGIHNSHAERLLAIERKARAETAAAPALVAEAAAPHAPAVPIAAPAAAVEAPTPEPAAAVESHGDDPYIETPRCTTCNECTQLNAKMFAYNEDKQAYIKDPDAGTYRQLVEAAEGCQVSIIHPGKPRNPKEPGLEELIKRAQPFL